MGLAEHDRLREPGGGGLHFLNASRVDPDREIAPAHPQALPQVLEHGPGVALHRGAVRPGEGAVGVGLARDREPHAMEEKRAVELQGVGAEGERVEHGQRHGDRQEGVLRHGGPEEGLAAVLPVRDRAGGLHAEAVGAGFPVRGDGGLERARQFRRQFHLRAQGLRPPRPVADPEHGVERVPAVGPHLRFLLEQAHLHRQMHEPQDDEPEAFQGIAPLHIEHEPPLQAPVMVPGVQRHGEPPPPPGRNRLIVFPQFQPVGRLGFQDPERDLGRIFQDEDMFHALTRDDRAVIVGADGDGVDGREDQGER